MVVLLAGSSRNGGLGGTGVGGPGGDSGVVLIRCYLYRGSSGLDKALASTAQLARTAVMSTAGNTTHTHIYTSGLTLEIDDMIPIKNG